MARKRVGPRSGKTVLLIDDNAEYLASTRRLLEREGHDVLCESGGREALEVLRRRPVDLVLVDYFMPAMTGEEFVAELRQFDRDVQVILQTGYASEQPPREMLKRLDIQGYHDKSEGPEKLCLWVDVGLKAAFTIQLLRKSRLGLRHILNATPELHRLQPLDELLQGILLQTAGLLGAADSFLAVVAPEQSEARDGFVALVDGGELSVRAATGRFARSGGAEQLARVRGALEARSTCAVGDATVAPLRVGDTVVGAIYLDRTAPGESDAELIEVFANQAAVAIHNAALYEMAALDPLTGTCARRFFEQALLRELRTAWRLQGSVGLLMVDLDDMKGINDAGGHLSGDRALAETGKLLRRAVRANDVVGRYGGDEFVVLLPGADQNGVAIVAERISAAFVGLAIPGPQGAVRVSASVGGATLPGAREPGDPRLPQAYLERTAYALVQAADEALYRAKRGVANGVGLAIWPALGERPEVAA